MNKTSLPSMVRNNLNLFVNKHVVLSDSLFPRDYFGGNDHLHTYIIFKFDFFDFFLSYFNNLFKHKKINNRKLNREKIDCQSSFGVIQGSVISTLLYILIVTMTLKAQT